jgi:hypothetical protein
VGVRAPLFVLLALTGLTPCAALAQDQHVVFTTRTNPTCPLDLSVITRSKEYGFQTILLRNISSKSVDTVNLKVSIGDQELDDVRLFAGLAPGEVQRMEVGLGNVAEATRRARSLPRPIVTVALYVASVEFAGQGEWTNEPLVFDPLDPPAKK